MVSDYDDVDSDKPRCYYSNPMSPIEVYIDNRYINRSKPEDSKVSLPLPPKGPGGEVKWLGDRSGMGWIEVPPGGENNRLSFTMDKEGARLELDPKLHSTVTAGKHYIVIKRVK